MSIFSALFGGGSKTSQSTSTSSTKTQDQRIGIEGGMSGQLVAPGGTLASPGSVAQSVGDFSNVTYSGNKYKIGMSGQEVLGLLQQQGNLAAENLGTVKDFASSSLAAVAATRTGELPNWQKYIPLMIVAGAGVLIWRKSH